LSICKYWCAPLSIGSVSMVSVSRGLLWPEKNLKSKK
jgi:hypothetical protein